MLPSSSITGWHSSSSSRSCHHRITPGAAAATRRSVQCMAAPLQQQQPPLQQQQQQQSVPLLPRQPQQLLAQQRVASPQQWQAVQPSRHAVIAAAAGRRRRQDVGAPEGDDPDLDLDDVMYAGDEAEVDDADVLREDDDAEEFEEFEEDEQGDDEFDEGDEAEDEAPAGEDWAAALDEFDTSLDAKPVVDEAPSKEEQELAAAKALVDYDDELGEDDGTSLIISEVPPQEPDRPKTFDEQTEALSPQDKATLEHNMASYTVFPMYDLDLLVSSAADGQLVLSDCFCLDTEEDSFLRPTIGEGIPSQPRHYQVIPWEHTKTGDLLKHKDPEVQRVKLYFLGLHSAQPHQVDMTSIFSFDVDAQTMVCHTPRVLGADSLEEVAEPVMRIREDGVWIEESAELPGTFFIAEGFADHPLARYENPDKEFDMHEYVKMGLWDKPRSMEELMAEAAGTKLPVAVGAADSAAAAAGEEGGAMDTAAESALEERLEELELMEELDDMPDVPAVDMM